MEIGVDSFAALMPDPRTGVTPSPAERMSNLLEEIEVADRAGLDAFGIGEHHRADFIDSAPPVILAAAAARTKTIRLHSAVTVLSAADPVRVFQEFATLDLISQGRAEIVAGRGSFIDAFPLFGLDLRNYDALFVEKLALLLELNEQNPVHWTGRFRPPLTGQGVFPRPAQAQLPIWLGVGGTPESFIRAGALGLPLMVAIIGGSFRRFRSLVDLYREAGLRAGHAQDQLRVGVHAMGFVAGTNSEARDALYPGWAYMFTELGKERGRMDVSRRHFDALCAPGGAFLVGDPVTVAAKLLETSDELGGVSRFSFQMSAASGDHQAMLRSIELLGTAVAPSIHHDALRETDGVLAR
ncbi:MAG: LLM class flavin-dependent oxidoreductase [Gemmatimonadaceae bacterium]|nr:LLM class flavin-dependent oxidoreductase [Gemmatimonadaceae bacterium]MDQ3243293.1 LLM class flavin-dependent oxidoreductase [Gemmatimonadota bacterium]